MYMKVMGLYRFPNFLFSGQSSKKSKNVDDLDLYKSGSLFNKACQKAGLQLKNGTVYNVLGNFEGMLMSVNL